MVETCWNLKKWDVYHLSAAGFRNHPPVSSELQGLASSPDSKTAYSTKHRRATTAGRGPAGTREKMSNNKKEGENIGKQ